jgi:hypothetical protein
MLEKIVKDTFDGKQEKYNTLPERRELRKNKIRYLIRCRTRLQVVCALMHFVFSLFLIFKNFGRG